ncbi:hypothetical protein BH09PSE4_BH09PSE4_03010 [soil metagenome]
MSHTPPIPEAQQSPFPLHPEPHEPVPEWAKGYPPASNAKPSRPSATMLAAGAIVGIGSAAIVAALLFSRRSK